MNKLRSVTVKFDSVMYEQIRVIAEKRGETTSDTIRHLIQRGLSERIMEENTDLISRVIRSELKNALELYTITPARYEKSPATIDDSMDQRVYLSREGKTIMEADRAKGINEFLPGQSWMQLRRRPHCPVN
jgi:hypothetical protein